MIEPWLSEKSVFRGRVKTNMSVHHWGVPSTEYCKSRERARDPVARSHWDKRIEEWIFQIKNFCFKFQWKLSFEDIYNS